MRGSLHRRRLRPAEEQDELRGIHTYIHTIHSAHILYHLFIVVIAGSNYICLYLTSVHTYVRTQMVYAGVSYGASEHAGEDRPPAGGRAHALLGFDDSQAARIEPARGEREE